MGLVYDAHPARAELFQDAIVRNGLTNHSQATSGSAAIQTTTLDRRGLLRRAAFFFPFLVAWANRSGSERSSFPRSCSQLPEALARA